MSLPVSVVMPLFDQAPLVRRAIDSVLAQTHTRFELIVVDDGSSDGGGDIVRSLADPRVRLLSQPNGGVSAARNSGARAARHELVAFLDADDEWRPGFLREIVELSGAFPRCDLFATGYVIVDVDGSRLRPIVRGLPSTPWRGVLPDYFRVASRSDPPVCASAAAVRRSALEAAGSFPAGIGLGEDLLAWARLAARGGVAYSSARLAFQHLQAPFGGRPSRTPATPDTVADGLRALLDAAAPGRRGSIRRYLGLWHRMRAAMYLGLGLRRDALGEASRALRQRPGDARAWLIGLLALLPERGRSRSRALVARLNALRRPALEART